MSAGSWRAFEGANGWYVAWEDHATGSHYESKVTMSERAARRLAADRNADEDDGDSPWRTHGA